MAIKILHLADIHLGVENYGKLDPFSGLHTRLLDFIRCFQFAIEYAIKEKVDLVVFAGDAYKTCNPTPTQQREFAKQLLILNKANIPIILIIGNHDNPTSFGKASSIDIFNTLDIENIYVISSPTFLHLTTKNGLLQLGCFPWPIKNLVLTLENYKNLPEDEIIKKTQEINLKKIYEFSSQVNSSFPSILAGHLTLSEAVFSGSERIASISKEPQFKREIFTHTKFNYIALGHIHKFQDLQFNNSAPIVYSGSLDRVDFGEEKEKKGFCLVSFEDKKVFYEFIETPSRPFITIEVTIEKGEDITNKIISQIEKYDLNEAIVRIIYTNKNPEKVINLTYITNALKKAFLVTGIICKYENRKNLPRVNITEELTVLEALEKYISNNCELILLKEDLKYYAQKLEEKIK